ncbi:MAG: helix-turn-helix transcriptional regulator [Bacilli bacterium]|nr:helix-turn-helix transcriptional regulator [Bacilli bacterium]
MTNKLKEIRKTHNKTQKEISDILQITQVAYHNYENNKRKIPLLVIIKLAKFYNIELEELIK